MTSIAKRPPTNSAGRPWTGETWSCSRCGETGPDRDDVPHSGCPKHPTARVSWAPHDLAFHPEAHAERVAARNA
jgi:hypothetical protein